MVKPKGVEAELDDSLRVIEVYDTRGRLIGTIPDLGQVFVTPYVRYRVVREAQTTPKGKKHPVAPHVIVHNEDIALTIQGYESVEDENG